MLSIPLLTVPDLYTGASEFTAPEIVLVEFTVSNAGVIYQLGRGWPGVEWLAEVPMPPKNVVLERDGPIAYTGIRFRNLVKGVPAQISGGSIVQRWDQGG